MMLFIFALLTGMLVVQRTYRVLVVFTSKTSSFCRTRRLLYQIEWLYESRDYFLLDSSKTRDKVYSRFDSLCSWGGIEKFRLLFWCCPIKRKTKDGHSTCLAAFPTDTTSQLNVLGHDRNTLGVNGAQICVLKEADKVSLRGLLQGKNSRTLEAKITLEILSNLTHKTLEGQLANEEIS